MKMEGDVSARYVTRDPQWESALRVTRIGIMTEMYPPRLWGLQVRERGPREAGFVLRPLLLVCRRCHLTVSHRTSVRMGGLWFVSFLRSPAPLDQGPALRTSFNLNYICADPSPDTDTLGWAPTCGRGPEHPVHACGHSREHCSERSEDGRLCGDVSFTASPRSRPTRHVLSRKSCLAG